MSALTIPMTTELAIADPLPGTDGPALMRVDAANHWTAEGADPRIVDISPGATAEVRFEAHWAVFEVLIASGSADGKTTFGSRWRSERAGPARMVGTDWPAETDLLLRKTFRLAGGVACVHIRVAIDNEVQVLTNGVDITGVCASKLRLRLERHSGWDEADSLVFTVPPAVLHAGSNLLAVQALDRGRPGHVNVRVTADPT
jgi:hypothetical protein